MKIRSRLLDFRESPITNFILEKLLAFPTRGEGSIFYHSGQKKFYGYNNTIWVDLGALGGSGSQDLQSVTTLGAVTSNDIFINKGGLLPPLFSGTNLVVSDTIASTNNSGISIISGSSGVSYLNLGNSNTEDSGFISYNSNFNWLIIGANAGVDAILVSSAGLDTFGLPIISGAITTSGANQFSGYGNGTITGTPTFSLNVDSLGNVIESAVPVASIDELIDGKSDSSGINNGSSIFLGIDAGILDDGTDNKNIGIGFNSLNRISSGSWNIGLGYESLFITTTGNSNIGIGYRALRAIVSGNNNVGIGWLSLSELFDTSENTAIGYLSGRFISGGITPNISPSQSLFLGANTESLTTGQTNEIVIGYNALGNGSNTATYGNINITKHIFASGDIEATSFNAGGTGSNVLLDNGTTALLSSYLVYAAKISQTGTAAPIAIVLENTIGAIVWSRTSTGRYVATLTGAFTLNKTLVFHNLQQGTGTSTVNYLTVDENTVEFTSLNNTGQLTDGVMGVASLEIRVYP